jgi:hypothetical protein
MWLFLFQTARYSEGGNYAMANLDWSRCPVVESVPGKVSGAWVLKGTRMPVSAIFENLEPGPISTTSCSGMTGSTGSR